MGYADAYQELADKGFAPEGARSLVDDLVGALTHDLAIDPAALGPIPPAVHAAMVRYAGARRDPALFVRSLVELATLMETAGMEAEAFATLTWAAKLGSRAFDAATVEPLAQRLRALEARVGGARAAELEADLARSSAAHLDRVHGS